MSKEFKLSVVAPDRTVVEENVLSLVAPGTEGYLGVLAGHVPTIVALKPGIIEFLDPKNNRQHIAIKGGFMEVSGGSVIVLADHAEHAREIDVAEAETRLDQARRALRGEESSLTSEQAQEEMEHAIQRLKAAKMA